jgi:aryl-alcohol dehydrogenase-like predicted oxidoreductase
VETATSEEDRMEYTRLGDSGLQVSRITIGRMSWAMAARTDRG